jgi:hypothetical protein
LGFRVQGLGFRVKDLGVVVRAQGLELKAGFRILGNFKQQKTKLGNHLKS